MRARIWLLGVVLFGCTSAAAVDKPSHAGVTIIKVRGAARGVLLLDPRGRVDPWDELKGEVHIPECMRWDGGTETTLYDSTSTDEEPQSDVVTQLELGRPIVGRYRLYAEATGEGSMSVTVTPVPPTSANDACPDLTRSVLKGKGRYVWNIDFLPDSGRARCPVRVSRATRAQPKK